MFSRALRQRWEAGADGNRGRIPAERGDDLRQPTGLAAPATYLPPVRSGGSADNAKLPAGWNELRQGVVNPRAVAQVDVSGGRHEG